MDINDLIAILTEGYSAEQAAPIRAAIEREAVKAKIQTLRSQTEFDGIAQERQRLEAELAGVNGQPGSRAYKEWYEKNWEQVRVNDQAIQAFDAKYGKGSFARAVQAEAAPTPAPAPAGAGGGGGYTEQQVRAIAQEESLKYFRDVLGNQLGNMLVNTSNLTQKHLLAGRKTLLNMDEVAKIARDKYQGDLNLAYDEYDRPEREKADKAAQDALVEQRVKEELQKRGASTHFPRGADLTPSALSQRTKAETDKFDRTALKNDLANAWMNSGETAA
jgi:hypothetical protein